VTPMQSRISIPFLATTVLLVATVVLSGMAERRIAEPLAFPLDRISSQIAGWGAVRDQALPDETLRALNATSYLSRTYQKGSMQLDLFVAFYAQQRAGESMHSPKHCLPGAGWEIWRQDSALVPVNGGQVEINKYSIQNSGTRMLIFYWYQSKTRIYASEYLGKILLARDTMLTGHTAGSIVRVMVPDEAQAAEEGANFAAAIIPEVQRCFGYDLHTNRTITSLKVEQHSVAQNEKILHRVDALKARP
jgi:EpsI family protein